MKGVLYAWLTVIVWAGLNIISRFCVLEYSVDIVVFTAFMIFATGVALMLIGSPVSPAEWKSGVKYSWLYTLMQMIRSFTMISALVYLSSTETSLLFNIEIVITYILAYLIFRRIPYKQEYWGLALILAGFVFFIFALPQKWREIVSCLILISATASCIRSIVVEETTILNPETTVRQKCGIAGYTLFYGGLMAIGVLVLAALLKLIPAVYKGIVPGFWAFFPDFTRLLHPATLIAACLTGFFVNACTTYLYYTTLIYSTSESFMAVRAFQPILTYLFETGFAFFYVDMRSQLSVPDYIFGAILIIGSFLILIKKPARVED